MPSLSIIIPTHKRADTLKRCLDHIDKQTIKDELDVIVVSDGYDKDTQDLFEKETWAISPRFIEIEKSQQGVARNKGIKEAKAQRTLFIGDDILLAPDACEKHFAVHKEQAENGGPLSIAVLGYTTWGPDINVTPVMKWLEKSGWQFGYPKIKKNAKNYVPSKKQHRFTYTSHISVPTDIAREHPFREDVTEYGWEDIEWGERLKNAPVKLFYEPDAFAFHCHNIDMDRSLERMETLGKTIKNFPNMERCPGKVKVLTYQIEALLPTMGGRHRRAFLRGFKG
ncbi:glycosyltransferase [Patescibacteria group bacterium]|nr:glycosyltransferase [Patescibacteria group bacterium]MBU1123568.1 glycosyltransferase [Patescibacteria group bacterium]MBU1911310.1 glycosyltransferase [Patescibacteria group bacterium]